MRRIDDVGCVALDAVGIGLPADVGGNAVDKEVAQAIGAGLVPLPPSPLPPPVDVLQAVAAALRAAADMLDKGKP